MAVTGGPILPSSAVAVTDGKVFPYHYIGDGANAHVTECLGVMASVDGDSIWDLEYQMPPVLPTGVGKSRLLLLADAVAGNAKINVKWASVAVGEDPSAATMNAETVQTVTWSTNDDDEYQELKTTLDADTLVAGEIVVMQLTFETASWTLAAILGVLPSIIWEAT